MFSIGYRTGGKQKTSIYLLLGTVFSFVFSSYSNANDIFVSGGCSLVNAIKSANAGNSNGGCATGSNGSDTIILPNGSLHLLSVVDNGNIGSNGLPLITTNVTIRTQTSSASYTGNATISRATSAQAFRIFEISATGTLTLRNINVSSGFAIAFGSVPDGGGIYNSGELNLFNSQLLLNRAERHGGGLFNAGSGASEIESSVVGTNRVTLTGANFGGGIYLQSGSVALKRSQVINNEASSGGGVINTGGTLTINNSEITSNTAQTVGGGILTSQASVLTTLTDSTVNLNRSNTSSGGGVLNLGPLFLMIRSTVDNNTASSDGAGLKIGLGTLSMIQSTVSNNMAGTDGGGIYVSREFSDSPAPVANVFNSTVSGNSSGSNGGGIYTDQLSTTTVANSTVARNTATSFGSAMYNNGTTRLTHSLFADNQFNDCAQNGFLFFTDLGNNWFEDSSCNGVAQSDPALGLLSNNGGSTKTHALLPQSGAIDAISEANCVATGIAKVDQRGIKRPQGKDCDIGAFEYEEPTYFVIPLPNGGMTVFGL